MSSSIKETDQQLYERMTIQLNLEQKQDAKAWKAGDPLSSVSAITSEWLTDVVCSAIPGAFVTDFRVSPVSTGTQTRDRIHISYNEKGTVAGLP